MTRKQRYGWSLLLPVLVPLTILIAAKLTGPYWPLPSSVRPMLFVIRIGLPLYLPTYLPFLCFLLLWGRRMTMTQILRRSWAMPIWFWGWCMLCLSPIILYKGMAHAKVFIVFALLSIPYNYMYAGLLNLIAMAGTKTDTQQGEKPLHAPHV